MRVNICLGGVKICLECERKIKTDEAFAPFIRQNDSKMQPDLYAAVSWKWEEPPLASGDKMGEDLIQTYYRVDEKNFCVVWEGKKGALSCTEYDDIFSYITCRIQENLLPVTPESLGEILRYFPMRAVFQHFHVLFFHAAEITYRGTGLLFAGPSGAGKSTQAGLWKTFRGAGIVCNDRTLLRKQNENWYSYGYPIDGSTPVRSGEIHRAGCIVLVEKSQDGTNKVKRLGTAKAAALLIPQLVIDLWSVHARNQAAENLFLLLEEIPVYQLTATMDGQAVACLEKTLETDHIWNTK